MRWDAIKQEEGRRSRRVEECGFVEVQLVRGREKQEQEQDTSRASFEVLFTTSGISGCQGDELSLRCTGRIKARGVDAQTGG